MNAGKYLGNIHICIISLAAILVIVSCDQNRDVDFDKKLRDFEEYLEEVVRCRKVTSGAITLVKDDRVVLARGFGHTDQEKRTPATNATRFCIGSLTKAFTSSIIAKVLSEHQSFTWDTPITDILNDFQFDDELRSKYTNLRDLLAHRLGYPSNFLALLVGFPENTTRKDFVRMLQHQVPQVGFRTNFLYSNYMYTLAGYLAEHVTGQSWEQMVSDYLLKPLDMSTSGFVNTIKNFSKFSPSFSFVDGKAFANEFDLLYAVDPSGPAGSIYTTADDMGKWMMFHLHNGNASGDILVPEKFLKETHVRQMMTPFAASNIFLPEFPIVDAFVGYNMGWMTSVYRGYKKLWHSGGIVNYSSLLWLFPDKNVGVYVTITGAEGNRKGPAIFPITSRAADILLGEEPWLNKTTGCSYPDPWSVTKEIVRANNTLHKYAWNITRNASDYAGIYSNPAYADMTIKVETGPKLKLYFGRFGVFSLYPITEEKFDAYLEGPLSYVTNSDDNTAPFHLEFIVDSSQVTKLMFPFIPADSIVELVKKNSKNQGSSANSVPNLHSNRFMKYVSIIDMFFVFLFPLFVSFFS